MDIESKTLFVALLVGLAHIVCGIAVLVTPEALKVTQLASLHYLASLVGYGGGLVGAVLFGAGLMAVIGGSVQGIPRNAHGALFLPQQILLLLQLWTITIALIEGRYPDGYTPLGGAWFIVADQIWSFILAASHSVWLAAFIYGRKTGGIAGAF